MSVSQWKMKVKHSRRDEPSAHGDLHIHGPGLSLGCDPRNLLGLCLRAHCSPVGDSGVDWSPPPCAPSPRPCTLYLGTVEGMGMETRKRRRRMESDPASFYPSCEHKHEGGVLVELILRFTATCESTETVSSGQLTAWAPPSTTLDWAHLQWRCQDDVLGFLVVLPRFLRGPLSAGPSGASWAPASFPLVVALLTGKPLTPFNIQAQVHHVTFEPLTWILQRHVFVSPFCSRRFYWLKSFLKESSSQTQNIWCLVTDREFEHKA